LISLNKLNDYYKKIKNNFLVWLGVKTTENCIINPIEELIKMNIQEKDILTDIVIDNHEEEFRIKETGDDGGDHFALYLPKGSNTNKIQQEIILKKIKKRVIIIEVPHGYIGSILR
jgi:hypothetical protein